MSKPSREEEGGVRGRLRKLGLGRKADDEEDSPTPVKKRRPKRSGLQPRTRDNRRLRNALAAAMEVLKTIGRPSTKAPGPRRCARSTTRS